MIIASLSIRSFSKLISRLPIHRPCCLTYDPKSDQWVSFQDWELHLEKATVKQVPLGPEKKWQDLTSPIAKNYPFGSQLLSIKIRGEGMVFNTHKCQHQDFAVCRCEPIHMRRGKYYDHFIDCLNRWRLGLSYLGGSICAERAAIVKAVVSFYIQILQLLLNMLFQNDETRSFFGTWTFHSTA